MRVCPSSWGLHLVAATCLVLCGSATAAPVGDSQLRTALKQIEDFRAGLVALFPGMKMTSRLATTLIVLKDFETFRNFQPRDGRGRKQENVGGYFVQTPQANYMVLGAYGEREATLRTVFHEYTHFLMQQNFANLPSWLNEGMADFYSTFRGDYKNGQALVGLPPRSRLDTIRERGVMPLDRILTTDGAAGLLRDPNGMSAFYAESWAFVHYVQLGNDGKRRGQIDAYLKALDQGLPVDRAFNTAFGVTFTQMQRELSGYVRLPSFPALLFTPKRSIANVAEVPVQRLSETDAGFLQADVLVEMGSTDDADHVLTNVLAIDPSHHDAKIAQARVRGLQGRRDEAIAALEALTTEDASSFAAHLYLASLLRSTGRYEDAMRAAQRAVALNSESTFAWYELSLAALTNGRDKDADDALAEIIKRDSDPAWYRTRTYDSYVLGRDDAVIRSAGAFIRAAGDGNESSPYMGYAAALACLRLGLRPDAAVRLKKVEDSVLPGSWQSLVAQYLQGQLSSDQLLDKAKTDGDRTEAHAYIGALSAAQGQREAARLHLRWVKDHGLKNYVEYRMALADLRRLEANTK